jgi:hypothetical protein
MAYFDDLPNELLADIINRLAWNPHTLARLFLVSHSLSRVAKEVLYTHIKCPWYGPSVISLARTLLDDPELGQKVKELQCDLVFNDYDNWDCSGWQSPHYNKMEVIGKAAIHLENFFKYEENSVMAFVTGGLVHGEAMAYAALILTLLPDLSSLCFSMDEDNDGDGVHDRPIEALFGLYQQTYTEPRDAPRFCRTLDTLRELKVPVDNIALLAFFPLDGLKFLEINFTDRNGRAYQQRQSLPTSIQARTLKELKLVIDCESICRSHGLMPSRLQESISALQVAETPYYP